MSLSGLNIPVKKKMNDNASVTSSSLVVAEKPSHRTGGCVGIFFQLFDWNGRFTKKKLFSKRLLPPDHAKEASKKFGSDEKLPKLRLIADENCGGFPNKNKNGVNGGQTPTLVARLMGLETMPPVHRDNSPSFVRDSVLISSARMKVLDGGVVWEVDVMGYCDWSWVYEVEVVGGCDRSIGNVKYITFGP